MDQLPTRWACVLENGTRTPRDEVLQASEVGLAMDSCPQDKGSEYGRFVKHPYDTGGVMSNPCCGFTVWCLLRVSRRPAITSDL